jgi:hypothetical protein
MIYFDGSREDVTCAFEQWGDVAGM